MCNFHNHDCVLNFMLPYCIFLCSSLETRGIHRYTVFFERFQVFNVFFSIVLVCCEVEGPLKAKLAPKWTLPVKELMAIGKGVYLWHFAQICLLELHTTLMVTTGFLVPQHTVLAQTGTVLSSRFAVNTFYD